MAKRGSVSLKELMQSQKQQGLEITPGLKGLMERENIAEKDEGVGEKTESKSNAVEILKELKNLSKNITKAFDDIKVILEQEQSILKNNTKAIDLLSKEFISKVQERVVNPASAMAKAAAFNTASVTSPLTSTLGGLLGNEEQQSETLKIITDQTNLLRQIEENTRSLREKIAPKKEEETEPAQPAIPSSFFDDITSTFKNIAAGIAGILGGAFAKKAIPKIGGGEKITAEKMTAKPGTAAEPPQKKGGLLKNIGGKLAGFAKGVGGLGLLGAGVEAYTTHKDVKAIEEQQKAGLITPEKAEEMKSSAIGRAGGGVAGAALGAVKGAAIGSVVPVVGTAVGGLVGGALGYAGGSYLGKEFAPEVWKDVKSGWKSVKGLFSSKEDENKVAPESLSPTPEGQFIPLNKQAASDTTGDLKNVREVVGGSKDQNKVAPEPSMNAKDIVFSESKFMKNDPENYKKFDEFRKQKTQELATEIAQVYGRKTPGEGDLEIVKYDAQDAAVEKFGKEIKAAGADVKTIMSSTPSSSDNLASNLQPNTTSQELNAITSFRAAETKIAEAVYEGSKTITRADVSQPIVNSPTVINAPVTNNQQMQNITTKGTSRNTESSYQQYNISRFVF